jgi:hypothetical protein
MFENNISETNSNNNIPDSSSTTYEQDEVDRFINSTSKYVNLPKRDSESSTYQFFKNKAKRKLVTKTFTDPITHQAKAPQIRVEYNVIDPIRQIKVRSY